MAVGGFIGDAWVKIRPDSSTFGAESEGKIKSALSSLGPIGAITGIGVAVGAGLLAIGEKFQASFNAIARGTGATGGALKGLEGDFKNVLSNTAGSFEQVQQAIIGLSRATGLAGPALDVFAEQEVTLARITKTDVAENIKATEPLFAKFGIAAKDQGKALDVLFKASQASGLSVADLAGQMKSGGTVLQAFGYSFSQSAALIASFTKAGINSDQAISAMKKGFASFAKAGEDPTKAMSALIKSIKAAPSEAAATGLALKAFGAKAGPELVAAIRSGKLNVDELTASIASGKNGILATAAATPTLAGAFGKLKNQLLVALEPMATKLLMIVTIIVGKVVPVVGVFIGYIKKGFAELEPVFDKVSALWDAFMGGFQNPYATNSVTGLIGTFITFGQKAQQIFTDVKMAVQNFFSALGGKKLAPEALTGWMGAVAKFGQILRPVFEFIQDHAKPILIGLGIAFALLLSPVLTIAGGLVFLYARFQVVRDVVQSVVGFFTNVVAPAFASFAQFLVNTFGPLVQAVSSRWGEIQTIVTTVIQAIATVIGVQVAIIMEIWNVFHATIWRVVVAVWNEIKLVVQGAVNVVADIIKFALDLLTGHWGKAWNDLVDIVRNVWNVIYGTIANALSIVGNLLGSLGGILLRAMGSGFDAIVGFLAGLPGKFLQLGGNIVDGLVTGIKNAAGRVADALISLIPSPLRGALSFLFGNSPSPMAIGWGHNLMDGIAVGIKGSGSLPKLALTSLDLGIGALPRISGASGGSSAAGATASGMTSGPSVVIHAPVTVNPAPGMDEATVGRVTAAQIVWQAKPVTTRSRS